MVRTKDGPIDGIKDGSLPVSADAPSDAEQRGRFAERPTEIPKSGWRDILIRTKNELGADNIDLVSAGVAFYAMLAIFPGIAALISLWGLFADRSDAVEQLSVLGQFLPAEAWKIISDQMTAIAEADKAGLGLAALLGLVLALWSASKGAKAMIAAFNIVYDETESRGFFMLNLLALLFSVGAVVFLLMWIGTIIVFPILAAYFGASALMSDVISIAKWPILAIMFLAALAIVNKFAPDRASPKWRWTTVGALFSLVAWIIISVAFAWYATNFADYGKTYGPIGAIISLLMWFYLSAFVVFAGAELNAEIEHQTKVDTTVGPARPAGERGAFVADTLGEKPEKLF